MPSFNFDIGKKERAGSRFLSDVRDELQRALATEKSRRKITQQEIADLLETSRAVINRQIVGLENIGIKRAAEILWAIGWEPHFEARPIPEGENEFIRPTARAPREPDSDNRKVRASALDDKKKNEKDKAPSAADLAYAE
jgi:HTH domain